MRVQRHAGALGERGIDGRGSLWQKIAHEFESATLGLTKVFVEARMEPYRGENVTSETSLRENPTDESEEIEELLVEEVSIDGLCGVY